MQRPSRRRRPSVLTTAAIVLPLAGAAVGLAYGAWREWSITHALDDISIADQPEPGVD